jgi:hypothetical protein
MSTSLRLRLNQLASSFASDVLSTIRGASLEELLAESSSAGRSRAAALSLHGNAAGARPLRAPHSGGRLRRRSLGDIAQVVETIVGLLKQSPAGLRAEQIRERLGLLAKELPRPLKEALSSGKVSKSGQKRATTYFHREGAPAAGVGGRSRKAVRNRRKTAKRRK